MVPPKPSGNVQARIEQFRKEQKVAAKVVLDAQKEREERLKKVKSGGVKKAALNKSSKSRAKSTTSSGPAPSIVPDDSTATGSGDWRTQASKNETKLPLGMRQKQVIDYLRAKEVSASIAEIASATGRNIAAEVDLSRALAANPKVAVDESAGIYTYQPDAHVRDKNQLFEYICRAGAPVAVSEIADAYRSVLQDVAALKAEGVIMGLHSFDPEVGCEVLYSVDTGLTGLTADIEVAALWNSAELPDEDEDLALELRKAGVEPAPRKAPRKRSTAEKKRKTRKASRLRAVTNVHLMHLLEGEAPTALDT